MSLKRHKWHRGNLVVLEHDSTILRGNPLGDPHLRKLRVWLPPDYDHGGRKRYPVLYDLVGLTSSGLARYACGDRHQMLRLAFSTIAAMVGC